MVVVVLVGEGAAAATAATAAAAAWSSLALVAAVSVVASWAAGGAAAAATEDEGARADDGSVSVSVRGGGALAVVDELLLPMLLLPSAWALGTGADVAGVVDKEARDALSLLASAIALCPATTATTSSVIRSAAMTASGEAITSKMSERQLDASERIPHRLSKIIHNRTGALARTLHLL